MDIRCDWKITPGLPSNLVKYLTRKFKVSTGMFSNIKGTKREIFCEISDKNNSNDKNGTYFQFMCLFFSKEVTDENSKTFISLAISLQ